MSTKAPRWVVGLTASMLAVNAVTAALAGAVVWTVVFVVLAVLYAALWYDYPRLRAKYPGAGWP